MPKNHAERGFRNAPKRDGTVENRLENGL